MSRNEDAERLYDKYVVASDHAASDYFSLIRELLQGRDERGGRGWQEAIEGAYALIEDEMLSNDGAPTSPITFGTSGWRGKLGKDVFARSVAAVTCAIIEMYRQAENDEELLEQLGVADFAEARQRGCVVGHDNRFGGGMLATVVARLLSDAGFAVLYAGETTTGVLSAVVLEKRCAFSINLTPSHNPLEYGGYKFNAADGGPAAAAITGKITELARRFIAEDQGFDASGIRDLDPELLPGVERIDSLSIWQDLVRRNASVHGFDLDTIMTRFGDCSELVVAIDSVHGASRLHIPALFEGQGKQRLITLRDTADVTFGGIAPEPSSVNMQGVLGVLAGRNERLKLGAIIDPDGDRIRFTDGVNEISMNQFGAMAYHFMVVHKKKRGMVAKTVATSNLANQLAASLGEELFEPRVGFKEFKPVIGKALVIFEESDGISIIGHTPEKDAYIGLLVALDMVLTTGKNLGDYLLEIENEFGAYYPDRDGIAVSASGRALREKLAELEKYEVGSTVRVGGEDKKIVEVITIDGRKMVLADGSWIMIRPSGTEPKVRFYVESRSREGTSALVAAARSMLSETGLI